MNKVAVYLGDQKLFASEDRATILFDSGTIEVHDGLGCGLGILFVYVIRPGQYAKVKIVDGVETVRIDE